MIGIMELAHRFEPLCWNFAYMVYIAKKCVYLTTTLRLARLLLQIYDVCIYVKYVLVSKYYGFMLAYKDHHVLCLMLA